jgi:uncharacterized SAM-binding protein YcdF (DUF218 family)
MGRMMAFSLFFYALLVVFVFTFVASLSLVVSIYTYSMATNTEPADVAVVLSAAILEGEPVPIFEERIKHAIGLYEAGIVEFILFTGTYRDGAISESEAAKNYALRLGVPEDRIYIETSSRITLENLQQAKVVADEQQWSRWLLVSDPPHMKRSMRMARDLGIDAHPAPTLTSQYGGRRGQVYFWVRETWLYANYLVARLRWRYQPPVEHIAVAGDQLVAHVYQPPFAGES